MNDDIVDDTGGLNIHGASSLITVAPVLAFAAGDLCFRPSGTTRQLLVVGTIAVADLLLLMWIWKIVTALFGNTHG